MRVEWFGQTAASLLWIASVLTYGISSTGDWLQMAAASAWLVANLAALAQAPQQHPTTLRAATEPDEADSLGNDPHDAFA